MFHNLANSLAENWPVWVVTITLVVAAVIDGLKLKVPNWITFPMIISGWIYCVAFSPDAGWQGLIYSLAGTIVGLALLLPAYAIGGMGAGDVKLLAAIGALRKDIKTYQTKGGKAVEGVKEFLKKLDADLVAMDKAAKADLATLQKINPFMVKFHQLAVPGIPEDSRRQNAADILKRDTTGTMTWAEAAKQTNLYVAVPKVLDLWQQAIKYLDGITFQMTLPGKTAAYRHIDGMAQDYKSHYKYVAVWKKVKDLEEHFDIAKNSAHYLLELTHNSGPKWRAAVASLVG